MDKTGKKCGELEPIDRFCNRPEVKRALRDLHHRRTHGISADDFDALLEKQGGVCATCAAQTRRTSITITALARSGGSSA